MSNAEIGSKLIKEAHSRKAKAPTDETNILDWSLPELHAYIKANTKKMSMRKKLKFGQDLTKRIDIAAKAEGIKK